jgi:microcystin-dependent protein
MATLTVTPTQTFVSGNTVTPATLNQLAQSTVALTAGTIVDADVSASAAIALSKLATGALPTAITVSSANMVTATAQALLPAGAVMPFAMITPPQGWLAANGTAYSRSTYATLFAAIGTTFGSGDGSTTFNLPDLRGIFVRGSGSQTISGTTYNKTFAAKEQDGLNTHSHDYYDSNWESTNSSPAGGAISATWGAPGTLFRYNYTKTTISTNGAASETRPANIALLYCIKF